jgi:hypothetical protein
MINKGISICILDKSSCSTGFRFLNFFPFLFVFWTHPPKKQNEESTDENDCYDNANHLILDMKIIYLEETSGSPSSLDSSIVAAVEAAASSSRFL